MAKFRQDPRTSVWRPEVHSIVAVGRDWSIGKNNDLLWRLPSDLEMFKNLTAGETLVMGRQTALSIGRALPNRKCLVLTQQAGSVVEGMINITDIRLATVVARHSMTNLFCIGGARLYNEMIPESDVLHLVTVDGEFPDADTHIDPIDMSKWTVVEELEHPKDPAHTHSYTYRHLIRA